MRRFRLLIPLCLAFAGLLATPSAQPAAAVAASATGGPELDELQIVGQRGGPGLWKVSHGAHVLWLLGTPDLLPARMEWDASAVEAVIAQSQRVIRGPRVSIRGGPLVWLRLYLQWRRAQRGDAKLPLARAVPPTLHARFDALRRRYAARDGSWESLRPMIAADRLYRAAVDGSHLKRGRMINETVDRLASRHRVKVQRVELMVEDPQQVLGELAGTPEAAELRCLESTVSRIESDMPDSARRAAAWARGDVAALRALGAVDARSECAEAIATTPRVQALIARSRELWVQAAADALATQASTFATRPIQELLRPDGVLQALRARGFRVEEP